MSSPSGQSPRLGAPPMPPRRSTSPHLEVSHTAPTHSASAEKSLVRLLDPLEIVSPLITADGSWVSTVDQLWSTLRKYFEFRPETSCGFHVHMSMAQVNYSLPQLRFMAKAIVFWEPATARCVPLSRQDQAVDFCKGVLNNNPPLAEYLRASGPLRGLRAIFDYIDRADRDAIVDFVCPDKFRAWNFKPSRTDGHGSIEFRRPPGVVTSKKTKHWIAFAMTFVKWNGDYINSCRFAIGHNGFRH